MDPPNDALSRSIQKRLLANFYLKGSEFYNLIDFSGDDVGFSVKKRYKNSPNNVSLFKVGIIKKFLDSSEKRVPLYVYATYGELVKDRDAISTRDIGEEMPRNEPIDIHTLDDYWYDKTDGKIYKGENRIVGLDLLEEFSEAHAASWWTFVGLSIRLQREFWRALSGLLNALSSTFEFLLWAISGARYSYDPIWAVVEEERNSLSGREKIPFKTSVKEGSRIPFLGYKASAWSVLFYCFLHLLLFALFYALSLRPALITMVLKNNFLTIAYVIASLWLIERAIPEGIKLSVKGLSIAAYNLKYRGVKIKL